MPKSYDEKTLFRTQVKTAAKFMYSEEENFQEAYNKIGNAFKIPGEIPSEVQDLFDKSESVNFTAGKQQDFWAKVLALKEFREKEGRFPLS